MLEARITRFKILSHPHYILSAAIIILILLFFFTGINRNLWIDETSSLSTTEYALHELYDISMNFENQAPLYFYILKVWRFISDSVIHSRLLSLLFSILALIYCYKLLGIFISKKQAAIGSLLLVLNPFFFTASFTIRSISLTIFICVFILLQYYRVFYNEKRAGARNLIFFSILSTIAVFIHYYSGFLLLALGTTLLLQKKYPEFLKYILCMIIPVLSLIPIYHELSSQVGVYGDYVTGIPSFRDYLVFIVSRLENYIVEYKWLGLDLTLRYVARLFLLLVFLLPVVIYIFKYRYNWRQKEASVIINLGLTIFFFSVLFFWLTEDFVMSRHTIPLFVLLIITIFIVLTNIFNRTILVGLTSFFLIIYVASIVSMSIRFSRNGFILANEYLLENLDQNSVIISYPRAAKSVFDFYYTGETEIEFLPESAHYKKSYDVQKWIFQSQEQAVDEIISKTGSSGKIFWLTTPWLTELHGYDFRLEMVNNIMDSLFIEQAETSFYGDILIRTYHTKQTEDSISQDN